MSLLMFLVSISAGPDYYLLGDDSWEVRDKATRRLSKSWRKYPAWCISDSQQDLETQTRMKKLLGEWVFFECPIEYISSVLLLCGPAEWCTYEMAGYYMKGVGEYHPMRVKALHQAVLDLKLVNKDEIFAWQVSGDQWGVVGGVNVLKHRASGNPLPYPDDPSGPKPLK